MAYLLCGGWLICWFFLFAGFARKTTVPVRDSLPFLISGYLLSMALGAWSVRLWLDGVHAPAGTTLYLGVLLLVGGQTLMALGRRALPLGNYDLVVRLSRTMVREGALRYVWHPMYTGLLLAAVGTSILAGNPTALWLCWFIGAALFMRIAAEHWG